MTALLLPTSRLVVEGWLQLAAPGVPVGTQVPEVKDAPGIVTSGFIRIDGFGGGPDRDVPYNAPVAFLACWFPPADRTGMAQWERAEQLARQIVAATYDRAFMGVRIDLSAVGNYAPARVHTAVALTEPDRVEEEKSDWARVDLDLGLDWSPA